MTQKCQGEVFGGFNDLHSKHAQILLWFLLLAMGTSYETKICTRQEIFTLVPSCGKLMERGTLWISSCCQMPRGRSPWGFLGTCGGGTQQVTAHRPRPWLLCCTKDVADWLVKGGQLWRHGGAVYIREKASHFSFGQVFSTNSGGITNHSLTLQSKAGWFRLFSFLFWGPI